MDETRPFPLSKEEWRELMAVPEVQDSWGLEPGDAPEEFASTAYAAKFSFVSSSPGYVGDLFVLHGNTLTGDAPFVFRRDEQGKLTLA